MGGEWWTSWRRKAAVEMLLFVDAGFLEAKENA